MLNGGTNDFGMGLLCAQIAVEVEEEQTIGEFGLALYERRAKGSSQVNTNSL